MSMQANQNTRREKVLAELAAKPPSRPTNDELAARVMDPSLSQAVREAAMVEFKRRGLMPVRRKPRQRAWNRA